MSQHAAHQHSDMKVSLQTRCPARAAMDRRSSRLKGTGWFEGGIDNANQGANMRCIMLSASYRIIE
jgi:hypothetical protein